MPRWMTLLMTVMCKAVLLAVLLSVAAAVPAGATPGDRPGPDQPLLTAEEMEQAFELIERVSPELVESMRDRYKSDPRAVEQAVLKRFPKFKRFLAMRRWDPQMFDLRVEEMRLTHQTRSVAQSYRKAADAGSEPEVKRLREQLETLVGELVTARDAIRRHELQRLEERLGRMKDELAEREQQRDQLVAKNVEELISEKPDANE